MIAWIILMLLIISLFFYYFNRERDYFNDKKYKYGIVLCCYNRPEFLKKTIASLSQSNLENSIICIIDDNSTDPITIDLIKQFEIKGVNIIKIKNSKNLGISKSLLIGLETLYPKCSYLTNIDSDVVMKKNWLSVLESTYHKVKTSEIKGRDYVITGFNCTRCVHPIIKQYDSYCHKKSIGGINMFFQSSLFPVMFKKILSRARKNHGWDWTVVKMTNHMKIPLITTKPSVIQHIGISGLNSNKKHYDYADDY